MEIPKAIAAIATALLAIVSTATNAGIPGGDIGRLALAADWPQPSPGPEATARSFMAQIADVSADRVQVKVRNESTQSVIATATASGKVCTFSLAPAPAGVQGGWLVAALECKPT